MSCVHDSGGLALLAYLLIALEWDDADAVGNAVVGALTHPRALIEAYARVASDLGRDREEVFAAQTARFKKRIAGLDVTEVAAARAALAYLAERIDAENAGLGGELPNGARLALASWD